ncbi:MAG: sensor histidine kinase [Pseudomonadota bacterium]|nr:sensor histidine kinase [Pseudomonadota bacterium]
MRLDGTLIALVAIGYLGLLFAIAYVGDKRADAGRSIIANPWIYALSLAVYCTTWTFYGSVGRAAATGIGFLPIYLGPTLMATLWWFVLRKMIRISRVNRITSIADFIASRYGKSQLLGGLVTVIAVIGVVPYIALQLKAVAVSVDILLRDPANAIAVRRATWLLDDHAFYIALLLAAFAILFGTRHLDATERHEGMVAAVAFESLVKLVAFVLVGAFVTWGIYDGFGDIFGRAAAEPRLSKLMSFSATTGEYTGWASLTLLSMFAIMFLPRQFQIAVVENVDERHLRKAIWIFPLYLLAINVFVLPIAFGGLLLFSQGRVDADTFVLALPLHEDRLALALFAFVGGLSAATAMVIVETIALSTMVCNDLVMPLLLRLGLLRSAGERDLSGMLLGIRRGAIVLVLLLGYLYFRLAGEAYALVSIGLISFAAVAQFAPVMLGGMYWRNGTRNGALAGLVAGFLVWAYTLLLPSFAKSGWLPIEFAEQGLFGFALLRPQALFGLVGLDQITHSLFWSMLANVGCYVGVSLFTRASANETAQGLRFVEVFTRAAAGPQFWRGRASLEELQKLLRRFLGSARADEILESYARLRGWPAQAPPLADAELVSFAETELAGAIGAASARAIVASVVEEEPLHIDDIMRILDETSEAIAHSRALEQKSRELEAATAQLRAANERLKELDRLKDDFVSTVSHELRTPLTSIRAVSEILVDHPETDLPRRKEFLGIILRESERLTRLINDVLDLAKLESGRTEWHVATLDLRTVIADAVAATGQLFRERAVAISTRIGTDEAAIEVDRDRLIQVLLNLLSNAAKFCQSGTGRVEVALHRLNGFFQVDIVDNGRGVAPEEQELIFEKFRQAGDTLTDKPQGTGLGLPISRQIVEHFGGKLWVRSTPGRGATFSFTLPVSAALPFASPAAHQAVGS